MNLDEIIFKGKKFSDILSEIYDNQKTKSRQISSLISELTPLITNIGDATLLVPLIKEYLDAGIKNDDQLVKLAGIVQRVITLSQNEEGLGITAKEKEDLMEELKKMKKDEGSPESPKT